MSDQDKDQFFGSQLPGTGGDFIDTADVEGHRAVRYPFTDDGSPDAIRRNPLIPSEDGADVEGHLFRNGPTTQGEIIYRGPGDNPHGER